MKHLTFLFFLTACLFNSVSAQDLKQSEEYKIGVMVKAVAKAIKNPEDPKSMQIIADYGIDTRYYTMIRGWLVQELKAAASLLSVNKDKARGKVFQEKVSFLKKAIRRIDLE